MAKILVIDDDKGVRHLLDAVLRHKGYHVLLAESGQKGPRSLPPRAPRCNCARSENAGNGRPDRLAPHPQSQLTQPVIMYSGAYTPKSKEQILTLGITEMLTKDDSMERLEEAVKRALIAPDPG